MDLTLENADIINKIIRASCEKRWKEALNNSIKIWYKKSKIELIHMNLKLNNNRLIGVLKRNNTNKHFQKKFWFRKIFFSEIERIIIMSTHSSALFDQSKCGI